MTKITLTFPIFLSFLFQPPSILIFPHIISFPIFYKKSYYLFPNTYNFTYTSILTLRKGSPLSPRYQMFIETKNLEFTNHYLFNFLLLLYLKSILSSNLISRDFQIWSLELELESAILEDFGSVRTIQLTDSLRLVKISGLLISSLSQF